MHNAIKASIAVFCIGLMAMYFTSQPVQANVDSRLYDELKGRYLSQENVILKLYFRLDRAEQALKLKVPAELEIKVNK